ncbi:MAG: TrbC family F-type conjugative pilus assembly protein [Steroidobacteraceae bacterium]
MPLRKLSAALLVGVGLAGSSLALSHPLRMPFQPGHTLSAKDEARLATLVGQMQRAAAHAASSPQIQSDVQRVSHAAETIANPEMDRERDRLLRFLGINPQGATQLYIFVSWSMPLPMLRAYEIEAMWTGAPLVFRGIPKGTTLRKFIMKDLRELVWGKGAAADIAIDPRLFDLYSVTSVPTIVLSKRVERISCALGTLSYDRCARMNPRGFIKVEGAITTPYALREFARNGWPQARVYLNALRKGYTQGIPDIQQQSPFTGKWATVHFPKPPPHR